MRVLGVAYRELDGQPGKLEAAAVERDLTFVGLIAMIDPPREEVKQAIRECVTAGIKTVMITGDHKNTATAIAKQLGFFKEDSLALSGEELDQLEPGAARKAGGSGFPSTPASRRSTSCGSSGRGAAAGRSSR